MNHACALARRVCGLYVDILLLCIMLRHYVKISLSENSILAPFDRPKYKSQTKINKTDKLSNVHAFIKLESN